jgi:hypothetical protein
MPVSSSTWQASHAHQFKLLYHQPCHQAIPCSNASKDETDHMQYEIKISDRRIEHCTSRAAVPTKSPSSSSSMPAGTVQGLCALQEPVPDKSEVAIH